MEKADRAYRTWRRAALAGLLGALLSNAAVQADPDEDARHWLSPEGHLQDSIERSQRETAADDSRLGGADWTEEEDAQDELADAVDEQDGPPTPCLSTTFDKVHNNLLDSAFSPQHLEWLSAEDAGPCQTAQNGLAVRADRNGPHALPPGPVRHQILAEARELLGTPYRLGGLSPQGFDCSGFVYYTLHQVGIDLPRSAHDQYLRAASIGKTDLQPGDLVFFKTSRRSQRITHVGIYLGENRFIHAPSRHKRVMVSTLDGRYWSKRFAGGGRLLPA